MSYLVECRLQQVAIVLQGFRGIVEESERGLASDITTPQQQRQYQPRRCSTDGACKQMLGEADYVDIRFCIR